MSARRLTALALAASVLYATPSAAEDQTEAMWKEIYKKAEGATEWTDYLSDSAAGSVSAASLLGISGETVAPVQNLRDLVAGLKGLSSGGDEGTLAVSFTPGRTGISPVSYAWYASSTLARALASTTFGYAQGDADIEDAAFERRAVSVETSFVLHDADDEVVMVGNVLAQPVGTECDFDALPDVQKLRADYDADKEKRQLAADLKVQADIAAGKLSPGTDSPPVNVVLQDSDLAKVKNKHFEACFAATLKKVRWNRSRLAFMYGTGWIRPKSGGGGQEGLGHTVVGSFAYGFEELSWAWPKNHIGLTVTYRQTFNEPVLESLVTGPINEKNGSLVVGQLAGGSNRIRGLVEVSNAKSSDITASQRAFKQAFGLDVRVYEGTWLNLRVGRQRSIKGDETETASLLSITYSPSALLK